MYINRITEKLNNIGMKRNLKGYNYVRAAIGYIIQCGAFIDVDTVYVYVAKVFLTNKENVERNIRYAIEKTWEKGNIENINKLFGYTVDSEKGKPTNSEFLFLIADNIKNL